MSTFTIQDLPELPIAARRRTVPLEGLRDFFDATLPAVWRAIETQGLRPNGPPLARYRGTPGETVDIEVGFPVVGFTATDDVHAATLPGGPCGVAIHVGPYDTLGTTWGELAEWGRAQGFHRRDDQCWEIYLSDPGTTPPGAWRTQLVQPVSGPTTD